MTDYRKLTYTDAKIQVDSAIRDGNGAQIDTTYVKGNTTITGATKCKITYDSKGLVTTGTDLSATDIPSLDWSKITSGKPTTLAGYGITDADTSINTNTGAITIKGVTTTPLSADVLQDYVQGPASSTADHIATYSDATGKIIKDSGFTIGKSVPSNAVFTDTWTAMVGATSAANGSVGYVNAVPPKNGYNTKFLRADGTWSVPAYPTVPTKVSQLQNDSGFITSSGSCNYAVSAGSVAWSDVTGKPGFVNNGTTSATNPNNADTNGFWYVTSSTSGVKGSDSNPFLHRHTDNNDFRILTTAYNTSWIQQIATDFRCSQIFVRFYAQTNAVWSDWKAIAGGWEQRFSGARSSGDIGIESIRGYSDCMIIARNTSNTNLGNSAVIVPISQFYGGDENNSDNWSNGLHPSGGESGSWFKSIMISTDDGTSTSYLIAVRLTSWTNFTIHDNWHSEIVGIWVR